MSILSVDTISPIGSGTTLTLNATETKVNNFITVGTGASVSSPSSNVLTLGTNSAERLRITSDGKVGINQSTWSSKDHMFEVRQSTNDKEIARFSVDGGSGSVQGKGFIGLTPFNTVTYPHVSIGVEEDGTSHYQGNLTFATRNASNDSAPIERMRITSDGKVGISSATPTNVLTVHSNDNNQLAIKSGDGNADIVLADNGGSARIRHSNTNFEIWTGGVAGSYYAQSSARRMQIDNSGNTTLNTGNLVIGTSGKGIDFSATSDATGNTSELLDDYEEGSWTPASKNAGSFTSPTGRYVKIGQQVTVWAYIPVVTDITSSSNFEISGLPYTGTSTGLNEFVGPIMVRWLNSTSATGVSFSTYQASGWNYLRIYASRDDGNNYEAVKHSDFAFDTPGIRFCHSYTV